MVRRPIYGHWRSPGTAISGWARMRGCTASTARPLAGEALPGGGVNALVAARDGDLWIGFRNGWISRLHDGHLSSCDLQLAGASVVKLVEDRQGGLWAALDGGQFDDLARFAGAQWEVVGRAWVIPANVLATRAGAVMAPVARKVVVLRAGAKRFEVTSELANDFSKSAEAPDGHVWMSTICSTWRAIVAISD